ncbi:hypothetical protein EFS32_12710 [Levilactobacillus parabrevis]|nr:hypothetical protein [Levilactobacillus parabrevis]
MLSMRDVFHGSNIPSDIDKSNVMVNDYVSRRRSGMEPAVTMTLADVSCQVRSWDELGDV